MKARWWYQCRKLRCGVTYYMVPAGEEAPEKVKCAWCGQWAEHGSPTPTTGITNLKPEIPPHFNQSIGCRIESRAHLEQIQKERGLSDFSPGGHGDHDSAAKNAPSTDWK